MSLPPRTLDTMSDAIAMSSPNWRTSKRAKAAAQKRLSVALFGDYDLKGERQKPTTEEQKANKLQYAAFLRGLAARGMKPRAFIKEALRLEAEAEAL